MLRWLLPGQNRIRAYLGLGGNLDDPRQSMATALQAIDADARTNVVVVSSIYRTPPWGKTDQPDFLNCAAEISTQRSPRDLLDLCLETERSLKRVRRERWGPRIVDLDVLIYGTVDINESGLIIPHPRMTDRAFVMVPLAEIAPEIIVSGIAVRERASALDTAGIAKLETTKDWWRA